MSYFLIDSKTNQEVYWDNAKNKWYVYSNNGDKIYISGSRVIPAGAFSEETGYVHFQH